MKRVLKGAAWIGSLTLGVLAIVYLIAWKSPAYYPAVQCMNPKIIPFAQYGRIENHARPMLVKGKNFFVFGSTHTRDPREPEISLIEKQWKEFKPTVALVEGRLGFLIPGMMDPVKNLGEGGKLKELANESGVKLYNWDLSKEILAKQLQKQFSPEQIALAQILNPYFSSLRFGKPANENEFLGEYFSRASYVGLGDSFRSSKDIDRSWKKYFPNGPGWRTVSDEQPLPGYLSNMMSVTNDLRNQQLVCAIRELVGKGERVFVLCGSSHAACIEPELKQ